MIRAQRPSQCCLGFFLLCDVMQAKNLAEDDDDSFLQAQWADPRGLKKSLIGTNKIDWKPK